MDELTDELNKYIEYMKFVRERIALLMTQKGVSANKMSNELGRSPLYLSQFFSGKRGISLESLFMIMEYLGIEPKDFFDTNLPYPSVTLQLFEECRKLDIKDQECYLGIIKRQNQLSEELKETQEALKDAKEKCS